MRGIKITWQTLEDTENTHTHTQALTHRHIHPLEKNKECQMDWQRIKPSGTTSSCHPLSWAAVVQREYRGLHSSDTDLYNAVQFSRMQTASLLWGNIILVTPYLMFYFLFPFCGIVFSICIHITRALHVNVLHWIRPTLSECPDEVSHLFYCIGETWHTLFIVA